MWQTRKYFSPRVPCFTIRLRMYVLRAISGDYKDSNLFINFMLTLYNMESQKNSFGLMSRPLASL